MSGYFFFHITSGRSRPTCDPHRWLLAHLDDILLAPAHERLARSPDDPDRCIRAALRRCRLALIQIANDGHLVVRHWSDPAPDIRSFAKEHRLARPGVGVSFVNVRTGHVVAHNDGEDVLRYGERVSPTFPWIEYISKYERCRVAGGDDENAAPASPTNFGWPDVAEGRLAWRVLKAIWNAEGVLCPNCDAAMILIAFSWMKGPLSFRSARIVRHSPSCRRGFESDEPKPLSWLASVLPTEQRPPRVRQWREFEIDWDRLVVHPLDLCSARAATGDVLPGLVCSARYGKEMVCADRILLKSAAVWNGG